MSTVDKQQASRALIAFVRNFTDVLEKQLDEVRNTMREAVDGVMQGIMEISDKTAKKKAEANEVLVTTYINPDAEAMHTMNSVQDEVERVLEAAQRGEAVTPAAQPSGESDELRNKLRRSAGLFSKHMEALETLDGELSGLLMRMMGLMSRDDVIAQRIEHVQQALQALQTSLSYILVDFDNRCKMADIERFTGELKSYVMKTYTMEEEKQIFREVFGEERKAS